MSGKAKGISNVEIKRMIENSRNDDLKDNFVGIFTSNEIIYFISFHSLIKSRHIKYPFLISNTDWADRPVTPCWSILDLYPKKEKFLFDLYGVNGLQNFSLQMIKEIIDKIIFGLEKMKLIDNKLALVRTKFLTADSDFFHFIVEFAKLPNIKSKAVIHMLEDKIQITKTDT